MTPVRRSYAAKFVLVLLAVTVLTSAVGAYMYADAGAVMKADTQHELTGQAAIQAGTLDEWLTRMKVQMDAISESAAFQSGSQSEIQLSLWRVVERDDDVEAAYYVDTANSSVVAATGSARVISAAAATELYGQREFTSIARDSDGRVIVSEPIRTAPDAAPVLLFATTVPDRENRAVIVVTNLETVSENHLHHRSQGEFVVVNESGTVVLAEDTGTILAGDPVPTTTYAQSAGFTTTQAVADGSTEVGYAQVDSTDWVVTTRVPTATAYALQRAIRTEILAIVLVVVGGAAVFGLTVGRDTVRSVRRLSREAARLRDGTLDEPVETDRVDEFGDLFRTFDIMRRSLREKIRTTEQARQEALTAKAESEAFSRHLESQAERYGTVMAACADGDLTRRIDPDEESEAMAAIACSFNAMMDDVQAQNERLETVSQVLSHDLRNPLNVAHGRAALLAEDIDSPHVPPIRRAVDRMDTIIDDALVLASQGTAEEVAPVTLHDAAHRAWGHVETDSATLRLDSTARFSADPGLLAHLFENLFRNAVEHGGREVQVTVGTTETGFYVADDGPGIPEAKRDAVREMGFTTNRGGGGTGFGLAIVDRVVDAHGWRLAVAEAANGGARFEVREVGTEPMGDWNGRLGEGIYDS